MRTIQFFVLVCLGFSYNAARSTRQEIGETNQRRTQAKMIPESLIVFNHSLHFPLRQHAFLIRFDRQTNPKTRLTEIDLGILSRLLARLRLSNVDIRDRSL